jgi:hypothetical protein
MGISEVTFKERPIHKELIFLSMILSQVILKNSVTVSQKTHSFSITNSIFLELCTPVRKIALLNYVLTTYTVLFRPQIRNREVHNTVVYCVVNLR